MKKNKQSGKGPNSAGQKVSNEEIIIPLHRAEKAEALPELEKLQQAPFGRQLPGTYRPVFVLVYQDDYFPFDISWRLKLMYQYIKQDGSPSRRFCPADKAADKVLSPPANREEMFLRDSLRESPDDSLPFRYLQARVLAGSSKIHLFCKEEHFSEGESGRDPLQPLELRELEKLTLSMRLTTLETDTDEEGHNTKTTAFFSPELDCQPENANNSPAFHLKDRERLQFDGSSICILDSAGATLYYKIEYYKNDLHEPEPEYTLKLAECGRFLARELGSFSDYPDSRARSVLTFAKRFAPFLQIRPLGQKLRIVSFPPRPIIHLQKRFHGMDAMLIFRYGDVTVAPDEKENYCELPRQGKQLSLAARNRKSEKKFLVLFEEILDSAGPRPEMRETPEGTQASFHSFAEMHRYMRDRQNDSAAAAQETRSPGCCYLEMTLRDFLSIFSKAFLEAGFAFSLDNKGKELVKYGTKGEFELRAESRIDWLDVRIVRKNKEENDYDPVAIDRGALREGLIRIDGEYHLLPPKLLRKLGLLKDVDIGENGELHVPLSRPDIIDELFKASEEKNPGFDYLADLARRLLGINDIPEVSVPASFQGELRPYQQKGFDWLVFLLSHRLGACLADDMGLGKTIQTIALICYLREKGIRGPVLLLVPVSTIFNWENELKRFAPHLGCTIHRGPGRSSEAEDLVRRDIILTSYHTLRNDLEHFLEISLALLVLDESQMIKNDNTTFFKAVKCLEAERRLSLTGTPIENSSSELWSQMHFLNPGLLGSKSSFEKIFLQPIENDGDTLSRRNALTNLRTRIAPFLLQRRKEKVAPELPPKEEVSLFAEMGREQRRIYEAVARHYRTLYLEALQDRDKNALSILLEGMLRLRQLCLFPGLADKKWSTVPSCKLKRLKPLLHSLCGEGHKSLVFSQFTSCLHRIQNEIGLPEQRFAYLDGGTKGREEEIRLFQKNPGKQVFLISLKAGGTGLNLTAADYVFLFDPWWNPAVEAQAIDRCHRIGQDKKVIAYKLLVRDSIEEKILGLQKHKRELSDELIQADGSFLKHLSREEILDLFAA